VTLSSGRTERTEKSSSEPPPAPSFDLLTLLDLFDGDTTEIAALLAAAIASIRSDAGAIAGAATIDDRRTILESAHRLKGTSGTIGDRRLYAVSAQIEDAAADVPNPIARLLLTELREAVSVLSAEIAAFSLSA
jgi:HPt (histidine-containing phosphotransfer) domain-containing protein